MTPRFSLVLFAAVASSVIFLSAAQLGLPTSNDASNNTDTLDLSAALGPIVINADGSTSRIANWHDLTPQEQERTKKRIVERNRKRLKELRSKDEHRSEVENREEL